MRTTSEQPVIGWKLGLALDPNHELVRLPAVVPWDDLTKEFGRLYVPDLGRPGIPVRLMAGLHLLKHTYGLSDEQVVKGWVENPYWQYFCEEEFFQHHFPIHPSQMTRWRGRIGEKGVEKLPEATVAAGRSTGTITEKSFERSSWTRRCSRRRCSIRRTRGCIGRSTGPC